MVGRPEDRQQELRFDEVHCRDVRLGPLVSKARRQPLDEMLPFPLQNSVRGDDEGSEIRAALPLKTCSLPDLSWSAVGVRLHCRIVK